MIKGLDRYLTQEPPDDSWWFEQTAELIVCTEEEFYSNEKLLDKWMEYLFSKSYSPEGAAKLISKIVKKKNDNTNQSNSLS